MSERFFVSPPVNSDRIVLAGDEARHLIAVMRAKVGDEAILFDGSGGEFLARVAATSKHAVELDIVERRAISRELAREVTLAVALPKGERKKWLVEKATELGVARLVPLMTERGVAEPVAAALDRLRRAVVEASKQCGRNRLMEISEPASAGDWLAACRSKMRLFADCQGQPLAAIPLAGNASIATAVGPEGGFTEPEQRAAASSGWQFVSLGPAILRVETAAIALAAWGANV